MEKITKRAIFKYEFDDSDLVDKLAKHLDDNANRIYDFFKMDESIEVPIINIIKTKKELDEIHRKFNDLDSSTIVPKWIVGFSSSDMQIYYLSLNDYKNTSHAFDKDEYDVKLEEYKKTILHEFIHYVNRSFCLKNNTSFSYKCLAEGIAQYLSGQKDNMILQFNYDLDDILNSNNCYNSWYLTTKYIIDEYPHDFLLDLLKDKDKAYNFLKNDFEKIKIYYSNFKNK